MFDIAWSELMVVAVIAVLVVGPKDLPKMLRAFGATIGKLKRMSGDFQRQFNEALREAELDDVRKSVETIGKIDPLADIRRNLAPAGKVGAEIQEELSRPVKRREAPGGPAGEAPVKPIGQPSAVPTDEPLMTGPEAAPYAPPEPDEPQPQPRPVYRGEAGAGQVGPLDPPPAEPEPAAEPEIVAGELAEKGAKP